MMKRSLSIVLLICMILGICMVQAAAVSSGELSDELSWELSTYGTLKITDKRAGQNTGVDMPVDMPDFSAQNPAPWQAQAASIQSVSLPENIRHIGAFSFYDCAQLHQIDLKKAQSFGESCFEGSGIRYIEIPYSISQIPKNCFAWCEELGEVLFHEIHYDTGIKVEGVTAIGEGAFEGCDSLVRVQSQLNTEEITAAFPSTLKTIAKNAFSNCTSLVQIAFCNNGKAVTALGEGAFNSCYALQDISIPTGISEISKECFAGAGLRTVELPENVQHVGEDAFAYCYALEEIKVYQNSCTFFESDSTTPDNAVLSVLKDANGTISYAEKYAKPYQVLCTGRRAHSEKQFKRTALTKKASDLKRGEILQKCSSCGYIRKVPIAKIQTVKLTKTSFYYTGAKQYPTASQVRITDEKGKVIEPSKYTVSCQTAGKAVGKHSVKIKFKSDTDYAGSFVRYYNIVLKGTGVKSVDSGSAKLRVHWKRQTVGTNGYQIRLCKRSDFKSGVILKTVRNPRTAELLINKGLARKTGYYIQIRTFRTVGKNKYVFSAWSKSYGRKTK